MDHKRIKNIVEAGLLAAGRPLSIDQLQGLFGTDLDSIPGKQDIRDVLASLSEEYSDRGIQVLEVASGYRIQVRQEFSEWISRLWLERPPRYSRALLETLSIIAYRQPVTRGEIEDVRGVAVSTNIVRTLLDRNWVRVLGHRDVPGRPAIYGTTRDFLDYFGLKHLSDLPTLADISDLDTVNVELDLRDPDYQESPGVVVDEFAGVSQAITEAQSGLTIDDDGFFGNSPAEYDESDTVVAAANVGLETDEDDGADEVEHESDPTGDEDAVTSSGKV